MDKAVKQFGLDIVIDKDNEYYDDYDNWLEIEMEIERAIDKVGEQYGFKVVGFMFQEDVTELYR